MEDIKKLVGKRIRELRIKRGLKQSNIAELIGLEPRSISRIESGYHFPKDEHLLRFAAALGVDIKDLFVFSDKKTEQQIQNEIVVLLQKANIEQLIQIYGIIEIILK